MLGSSGFWIIVWFGIFLLGIVGLWASLSGGKRLHWRNLDELLRAIGTMMVSGGMLLLLYGVLPHVATGLLGLALGVFVAAFVAGQNLPDPLPDDADEEDELHPALRQSGPQPVIHGRDRASESDTARAGTASASDTGGTS